MEDLQPDRTDPSDQPPQAVVQKWTTAVLAALGVILVLIIASTVIIHAEQSPAPAPTVNVIRMSGMSATSGMAAMNGVDYLSVAPGVKPGPDGKLHDAFSQTTFYVKAGQAITLVISNTDSAPHSIVSAGAGVHITVRPGTHSYTLMVRRAGTYEWRCDLPCDPYSMSHLGYMMGTIVAT